MLKDIFGKKRKYASVPSEQVKKNIPEGLMKKCSNCHDIYYRKELVKNLQVCPSCGYHHQMSAWERVNSLIDENTFTEWDHNLVSNNPLEFPEYLEKLEKDRKKTGLNEGVLTGTGHMNESPVALAVMDSGFRMGSMGSVIGEKIARAVERAREERLPFLMFTASGGARMQEGVLSLMQMAKTSTAIERLSEDGLLMISVMTHPTTGGVTASFASIGDYNFGEPGALIGFAGRRVIEQTTREKLPDDFQTSEFLLKHGQLDQVIHRHDLHNTLSTIIDLHQGGGHPA